MSQCRHTYARALPCKLPEGHEGAHHSMTGPDEHWETGDPEDSVAAPIHRRAEWKGGVQVCCGCGMRVSPGSYCGRCFGYD